MSQDAAEMLLRLVREFRRALDLSLVLEQEGVAHELRSVEDRWALIVVSDEEAARAEAAVTAFERENAAMSAPREAARDDGSAGLVTGLIFFLGMLAFQVWTGPQSANAWFTRGAADAAAILRGEWWRTVTALTLHADAGHAAGNALLGGLLLALLARRVGSGLACWTMLSAGIAGTALAAELMRRHFSSVGASTAVFAALAALASLQAFDPGARRRAFLPLAAGLALLGFLGSSQHADFAGHLCGFGAGLLSGAAVSRFHGARRGLGQVLLALCAAALPVLAWLRAFLVI